MKRWHELGVAVVIVGILGSAVLLMRPIGSEAAASGPESLPPAMSKLTEEIARLRQVLSQATQAAGDPWGLGLPLTPVKGSIKLAKGEPRRFIALAGVHYAEPRRRIPGHFLFGDLGNSKPEHIIPIQEVSTIRLGREFKNFETTIELTYTNGTKGTYPVGSFRFYMDVRWADDVPVTRYTLSDCADGLGGAVVLIDKPE